MRLFIAVEIPRTAQEGLAAVQDRLKDAGLEASWSRPESIHLTLKFLGETSEERVPDILRALATALSDTQRFRLGIEGAGAFPNPAAARVVWLGLTGDVGRLVALQAAVERILADLGMARDSRPYAPHLTLGRIKRIRRPAAWLKGLEGAKNVSLPGFDVISVSLISSELRPGGAVYRELGRVALR